MNLLQKASRLCLSTDFASQPTSAARWLIEITRKGRAPDPDQLQHCHSTQIGRVARMAQRLRHVPSAQAAPIRGNFLVPAAMAGEYLEATP